MPCVLSDNRANGNRSASLESVACSYGPSATGSEYVNIVGGGR
jgi:hypothetical protein